MFTGNWRFLRNQQHPIFQISFNNGDVNFKWGCKLFNLRFLPPNRVILQGPSNLFQSWFEKHENIHERKFKHRFLLPKIFQYFCLKNGKN